MLRCQHCGHRIHPPSGIGSTCPECGRTVATRRPGRGAFLVRAECAVFAILLVPAFSIIVVVGGCGAGPLGLLYPDALLHLAYAAGWDSSVQLALASGWLGVLLSLTSASCVIPNPKASLATSLLGAACLTVAATTWIAISDPSGWPLPIATSVPFALITLARVGFAVPRIILMARSA